VRRLPLLSLVLVLAACGGGSEPSSQPPAAGVPGPGGGLTVSQALKTEATGILMVRGAVLARDDGEARLCSALGESYPPQCGGPSLKLEDLRLTEVEGIQTAQGVSWSEREVRLYGTLDGDVLTVSHNVR
jgi:hypothetical protein